MVYQWHCRDAKATSKLRRTLTLRRAQRIERAAGAIIAPQTESLRGRRRAIWTKVAGRALSAARGNRGAVHAVISRAARARDDAEASSIAE
jgi:hypothetical protein